MGEPIHGYWVKTTGRCQRCSRSREMMYEVREGETTGRFCGRYCFERAREEQKTEGKEEKKDVNYWR